MKRVLFITYYWPPSGKASLHWPLGIIKHLPKFNWEPIVLTVEEESFTQKDESLLKEVSPDLKVVKTRVIEVFNLYKKFIGKSKGEPLSVSETMSKDKGIRQRISLWIRMNLFIPDARILWYWNGVKGGEKFLRSFISESNTKPVDVIISIGTPHSTHLVGRKLSKEFNIPHVPLFTDPWTTISYYKKFKRNIFTEYLDKRFERKVLENSAAVIFVTNNTLLEYVNNYSFLKNKSSVLYWGYNEENFTSAPSDVNNYEKILLHTGNLFDYQNPQNLWKTIRKEIDRGENLKMKFTGTVGPQVKKSIEENNLKDRCEYLGFLTYDDLIREMQSADYLLLCPYDKRHVPGKIFEYLRVGKPIIAFCDDNEEVKNILTDLNAGILLPYNNNGEEFFNKINEFSTDMSKVKKFDRYEITKELSVILNNL